MCLAPKVRHFNKTTKAPVDLSRLQRMKQFLPPKSKALKVKTAPSVEKKVEVALKPAPQEPHPTARIAPRPNPQAALDAIFRDSFGASPSGDIVLIPRFKGKDLSDRPESPFIKRTLSFCSTSSETTSTATNAKHIGSIYLYADCRCVDEEKKEEYFDDYYDNIKSSYAEGLCTPPVTHFASLSPPPSPRPRSYYEQEISFPEALLLPSFP